jgi:hypothetical protein
MCCDALFGGHLISFDIQISILENRKDLKLLS